MTNENICIGCIYYWDNSNESWCHIKRDEEGNIISGYCRRKYQTVKNEI